VSISRVNFFNQADTDSRRHHQQIMLKRAHEYLIKNNIHFHNINKSQYFDKIKAKIDTNITIQDWYINNKLDFFNFESTFQGLIIDVDGKIKEIDIGDNVNIKPLSVVCVGSLTKQNIIKQKLLPSNHLTVDNFNHDVLSCCNIKVLQQPDILTSPEHITIKYHE